MRIDGLSIYNRYDNLNGNKLKEELQKSSSVNTAEKSISKDSNDINKNYLNGINPNKIITKHERQYFKQMFPESSDLIENHVLFNRNAKIQSPDLRKGQLVDGIV